MGERANATPWHEVLELGIDTALLGMMNKPDAFIYRTALGAPVRFSKPNRRRQPRPGKTVIGAQFKMQRLADDHFMDADAGDAYDRGSNATMVFGDNPTYVPLVGNVGEMSHAIRDGVIDVSSTQGCDASAANLASAIHRHDLNVEKRFALFLRTSTWHAEVTPAIKWDQPGARAIEDFCRTADLIGADEAIMSHEAYNLMRFHEDGNAERQGSSVLSHLQLMEILDAKASIKKITVANAREKRTGLYPWLYDRISPDGTPWIFFKAGDGQILSQDGAGEFKVGRCAAKYIVEDIPSLRGVIASQRYGDLLLEQGVEVLARAEICTLGHAFKFQQVNKHAGALLTGLK